MKCKICFKQFIRLASHLIRTHNISYEDYLLLHEYDGIRPKCKCGCGKNAPFTKSLGMSFKDFIHGHHVTDREISKETRKKIGEKNSINMKCYFKENPEIMKKRIKQMQASITPETEIKRIQATKDAYDNMTQEDKQKFSDNTKRLWNEERELMQKARNKACETFKLKFQNGEYDFTERNEKISEAITKKYIEGGFQWSRGHYTSTKTGKTYYYRSNWEYKFMQQLDLQDNLVTEWDYEPFSIKYTINRKTRNYIPDFITTNLGSIPEKEMVEIKPTSLTETIVNKAKREAAKEWCKKNNYAYVVLMYNETDNKFYAITD